MKTQTIILNTKKKLLKGSKIQAVDDLKKLSGDCLCDRICVTFEEDHGVRRYYSKQMYNQKPNWEEVVDEVSKKQNSDIFAFCSFVMFFNNPSTTAIQNSSFTSFTVK